MQREARIVYAEQGEDFQRYWYDDGTTVPVGEPIGVEIYRNKQWHLVLLSNVKTKYLPYEGDEDTE
jgi:hypothetical protein